MTFQSALALGIAVLILAPTPGPGVLTSVAHSLSKIPVLKYNQIWGITI